MTVPLSPNIPTHARWLCQTLACSVSLPPTSRYPFYCDLLVSVVGMPRFGVNVKKSVGKGYV